MTCGAPLVTFRSSIAARGIASVQLDVRGTGGSEGVVIDEYQYPQEQEDGYDAIEWLAHQAWCNGRAGMWGTSYAGFTALQVAQLHPPSLAVDAGAPVRQRPGPHFDHRGLGGLLRQLGHANTLSMSTEPPSMYPKFIPTEP